MRIVSGRVVDGKVVVDEGALVEGATVTVVAPDGDEAFEFTPDDEAALLAAIRQAERGDVETAEDVLDRLRPSG